MVPTCRWLLGGLLAIVGVGLLECPLYAIELNLDLVTAKSGGARVIRVYSPGFGEDLGLQKNDVIRYVNGHKVSSYQDYLDRMAGKKDDYTVIWQRGPNDWWRNSVNKTTHGGGEKKRPKQPYKVLGKPERSDKPFED